MRVSRLESLLERMVPPIPEPRPELEQYTTPAGIALRLAQTIAMRSGLDYEIADLGAGTCRLTAALALLGAEALVAVEADRRLTSYCIMGLERLGVEWTTSIVVGWVGEGPSGPLARADLVVMNPPFGVQRRGADTVFLAYSFSLRPWRVYAILKSGNEDYHRRLAEEWGYSARILYREWFSLPATMAHHRSRTRRVEVDVYEFEKV